MLKAKRKYSGRAQQTRPEETTEEEEILPSLIELHYDDDSETQSKQETRPYDGGWRVGTVILTDSEGN